MTKHRSGVFFVAELTGEQQAGLERRLEPRLSVKIPVTAEFHGAQRQYRVLDVSRTGALLERDEDEAPPSLHTLVIGALGRQPLRVLARTVWVAPRHHAVRFVAQDDIDRLELAERLDKLIAFYAA
ncbi:MAG: PilZ domain-containing protein [Deltaproteobacteria bacterium]|nr:PilZ domain-containing protein [Deltaproteobacteria bacterium]